MSRLQHGPGYSSPMLLGKTSAVDFAATGDHINLHRQTSTKEHPRRASTPTETMSEEKGGPSGSDTTNNADGNESDGAESDDADGNVGEPDVLAPSGTNIDIQTGLHRDSKDVGEIPDTKNRGGCPGLLNTKPPSRSPNAINQSSASKQNPVSSDDDYNGVDLISESAEDQPMMESIEEKAIIESEEEHVNLSRLLSPPDSSSDAFQFNLAVLRDTDYDAHAFVTDDPVFQDRLCLFDPDHCEDDDVDYHGFVNASRLGSPFTPTTRRRVRFADPPLVSPEADTRNTSNLGTARSPRTQLSGYAYDEDQPLFAEDVQSLLGGRATISREAIAHGSWHNDRSSSGEREFVKDGDDESSVGNSSGYESA
ncbi:MAG: hypothetical protein LQ352_003497 [Teloschistes flavicans]|nr:MAG: hypothetical protein LQ352_003497 [Teloschistes flavicans]